MSLNFLPLRSLVLHRPLLIYALSWTALLTVAVAVASFSPEMAFAWAVTPTSAFSEACPEKEAIRVPLGWPGEVVCLPAQLFQRSKIDVMVPPMFAALVVAGAACFVRAMGLWEGDSTS